MIPLPTYLTIANYASSGTQDIPTNYATGFPTGVKFPATWANWLFGNTTSQLNLFETTINNINSELLTIVTDAGLTPSGGSTNQVYTAIYNLAIKNSSKASVNVGVAAAVGTNALTVSLVQADGATAPGANQNQVILGFRSSTLTNGGFTSVAATAATSLTVASGATLGTTNAVASNVFVYALNNAGTIELAVSGIGNWDEGLLQSTTALSGSSNSGTVLYSTTSRSNVAIRLIGVINTTEATAGTWATAPTQVSGVPFNQSGLVNKNLVQAGPASGSAATPTYRALVNADIPIAYQQSAYAGLLFTWLSTTTFSIGVGVVADSTYVDVMRLAASTTKSTGAWAVGSGNGGLDTGAIAASTWYYVYVIKRVDTGVVDVLYSLSSSSPTLPANYTLYRLIDAIQTDGSSHFVQTLGRLNGRHDVVTPLLDVNDTSLSTTRKTETVGSVPGIAHSTTMNVSVNYSGNTADVYLVGDSNITDSAPSYSSGAVLTTAYRDANCTYGFQYLSDFFMTGQSIFARSNTSSTTLNVTVVAWNVRPYN